MNQQGLNFFAPAWYVGYYSKCNDSFEKKNRQGGRKGGRTDGRMDGWTNERKDGLWAPDLVQIFAIVAMF